MKATIRTSKLTSHALMSVLAALIFFMATSPAEVRAQNDPNKFPALEEFITTVTNGNPQALRGVYVPQVMSLTIVQQPQGDSRFVSRKNSVATQFSMAAKVGNIGLLAHNDLAGRLFFAIQQNDLVILIYGNGRTETFIVDGVHKYQAVMRGTYIDMDTQNTLGTGELFDSMYRGDYHVTLQTCIEKNGNPDWGRLFIIARPVGSEEDENDEAALNAADVETAQPPIVLGWPIAAFDSTINLNKTNASMPLY